MRQKKANCLIALILLVVFPISMNAQTKPTDSTQKCKKKLQITVKNLVSCGSELAKCEIDRAEYRHYLNGDKVIRPKKTTAQWVVIVASVSAAMLTIGLAGGMIIGVSVQK
jgi:hypothetical protein